MHAATVKGKGFAAAEEGGLEGMETWHAAKPRRLHQRRTRAEARRSQSLLLRRPRSTPPCSAMRWSTRCAATDIVGITAAMSSAPALNILQKAEPDHYFDVGIAEQQALLFASGLALEGLKPVAAIYSTFLQRGFDQIVHDICLQELDVVLAMDRAG